MKSVRIASVSSTLALATLALGNPAQAAVPGRVQADAAAAGYSVVADLALTADQRAEGTLAVNFAPRRGSPARCVADRFHRAVLEANEVHLDVTLACTTPTRAGTVSTAPRVRLVLADQGAARPDELQITSRQPTVLPSIPRTSIQTGVVTVSGSTASADERLAREVDAVRAASLGPAELSFADGHVVSVHGAFPVEGADPVARAANFVRRFPTLYGLAPEVGLGVRRQRVDGGGAAETVRLYQTWQGLPVFGAELVVHLQGHTVVGTVGRLLSRPLQRSAAPALPAAEAEAFALRARGPYADRIVGTSALMVFDPAILGESGSGPTLAWRVLTGGSTMVEHLIDADSGEVLRSMDMVHEDFDLDLATVRNGTSAPESGCYYLTAQDDDIGDADGVFDPAFQNDADALGAHGGMKGTYDYYLKTFGLDSVDDDGLELEVFIDALIKNAAGTTVMPNARHVSCDYLFGYEEVFEFSDGWAADAIVTHEYTHGVVWNGANLASGNAPGTLNEALADIQAFFRTGLDVMAMPTGRCRNWADPTLCSQQGGGVADPNRWSQRYIGTADDGGVHLNAPIITHAAYLMARGGMHLSTGVPVQPQGDAAVQHLFYMATQLLPSSAGPNELRAMLLAHVDQSGSGPGYDALKCSIRNAFGAIDVGAPDYDCDGVTDILGDRDLDAWQDTEDNCPDDFNLWQDDQDGDGLGDVCDPDRDGDGVKDQAGNGQLSDDNCPEVFNPDQADFDGDLVGTVCDPTEDGDGDDDGVADVVDDCPDVYNPKAGNGKQPDADLDGEGDACDPDRDGDGASDNDDNCPDLANPTQANRDQDALGDACDPCPTGYDHVSQSYMEDFLTGEITVTTHIPDADGDGTPDSCEIQGIPGLMGYDRSRPAPGPDGTEIQVQLALPPRSMGTLPLSTCIGSCPVAPQQDACVSVDFGALSPEVHGFIVDETGRGVARASKDDERHVARLKPEGGHQYRIALATSADFSGREAVDITVSACRAGDRDPRGAFSPVLPVADLARP